MATVELDFDLYLYAQSGRTMGKYYKIFTSTVEMINTSGGSVGLYPSVFKRYVGPMDAKELEKKGGSCARWHQLSPR